MTAKDAQMHPAGELDEDAVGELVEYAQRLASEADEALPSKSSPGCVNVRPSSEPGARRCRAT